MVCAIIGGVPEDIHASRAPFDGRWWLLEDHHVVGGRLSLIGGVWDLTVMGWLGPWDPTAQPTPYPRTIHGEIGTTPVTLLDVVGGGWKARLSSEPPYISNVKINQIVVGGHADPHVRFKGAGARLLQLNEWANRRKFTTTTGENFSSDTVVYTQPRDLEAQLPHAKARLSSRWGQSSDPVMLSSVSMTADEWVFFDFETPLELETVQHDYVRPLANLLELVSNRATAVLEFVVTPDDADDRAEPWSVLSWEARDAIPAPRHPAELIFTLRHVDFTTVMPAWWRLQPDFDVVAMLLSSVRGRSSVANQFLNAASAIESYHRHLVGELKPSPEHEARKERIRESLTKEDWTWLGPFVKRSHEPSFGERVQAVVGRAGALFPPVVGNVKSWRTWVREARDSVAHRGPRMFDIEAEWMTAVRVTETIKWLLTLVLLRDLGIPDDVIAAGVQKEGGLGNATELMKQQQPDWFVAGDAGTGH